MVLAAGTVAALEAVKKTILQAVVFVASTAYQINQYKKLQREADKRKGFRINKRGEAVHIPIVYGKQAVGLIEANHLVTASASSATVSTGGTTFNSQTEVSFGSGTKNEFLNMNGAICQGGIEGVQSIEVDEQIYNKDKKHRHRIDTYTDGLSATAALGSNNGLPDDNKFTGLAHADCVFRLNRDDYNYNGIPNLTFFVKGRKVRDINSNGTFTTSRIYSNNPALVLADYLTSDVGRNLNDGGLDLDSFYQAKVICDQTVLQNVTYAGSVNGVKPVEDYNTKDDFPGISTWPNTNTDEPNESVLYRAKDTETVYEFNSTGTEQNPSGNYSVTALPGRDIPLYECNIILDSEAKVRDNIEEILSTMPLATLSWSSEGKYKLRLAYPDSESDFSISGGAAEAVITFDSDNVIRDSIDIAWLSASERYNKATVTFLDEHENFKENSATWPTEGSTAYNTLLNQDNGQPMTTDLNLNGITDPYHALAYAEFIVRQSRTFHTLSFTATKVALGLEPGDYVKVHKSITGNNISGTNFGYSNQTDYKYYKINSIEINEDFTVKIEAHFVDLNAFAWNITDDFVPTGDPGTPDFNIGAPSNVVFDTNEIQNLGTWSGTLTWDSANDSAVINYIVQVSKYDDSTSSWGNFTDLGIVSKDTLSFEIPGLQVGTYRFGVRSVASSGALSSRAISTSYTLQFSGSEKFAMIYANSSDQDTNNQSYNQRSTDTHFAFMVYLRESPPTLPVRSSPSVSDATDYTDPLDFTLLNAPSTITIPLYRRSTTDITGTAVSGGTYNFSTNTVVPPTGWSNYIPSGVGSVYEIIAKATGDYKENINVALTYPEIYPGLHGSTGEDGTPAPRYQVTRVYNESATAGNAPSGTITWSTLAVSIDTSGTGVNAGWTTTQPTIDADSTNEFWFSDILFTDTTGEATTTGPVTGSTPGKQINFDGIVSFTDISTEGGMGTTTIHGGNITTGTLTADQLIVSANNNTNLNTYVTDLSNTVNDLSNDVSTLADNQITTQTGNVDPNTLNNTNVVDGSVYHQSGNTTNTSGGQIYRYDSGNANWIPFSIIADSVATNYVYAGKIYTDNLVVGSSGNTYLNNSTLSSLTNNLGTINAGAISGTNVRAGNLNVNSTGAVSSGTGMYASSTGTMTIGSADQYMWWNGSSLRVQGEISNITESHLKAQAGGPFTTVDYTTTVSNQLDGAGSYVFVMVGGGGGGMAADNDDYYRTSGGGAGGCAIFSFEWDGSTSLSFTRGNGGTGNNAGANSGNASFFQYGNTLIAQANGGSGGNRNGAVASGGNATVSNNFNSPGFIAAYTRSGGNSQANNGNSGGGGVDFFGVSGAGDTLVTGGGVSTGGSPWVVTESTNRITVDAETRTIMGQGPGFSAVSLGATIGIMGGQGASYALSDGNNTGHYGMDGGILCGGGAATTNSNSAIFSGNGGIGGGGAGCLSDGGRTPGSGGTGGLFWSKL